MIKLKSEKRQYSLRNPQDVIRADGCGANCAIRCLNCFDKIYASIDGLQDKSVEYSGRINNVFKQTGNLLEDVLEIKDSLVDIRPKALEAYEYVLELKEEDTINILDSCVTSLKDNNCCSQIKKDFEALSKKFATFQVNSSSAELGTKASLRELRTKNQDLMKIITKCDQDQINDRREFISIIEVLEARVAQLEVMKITEPKININKPVWPTGDKIEPKSINKDDNSTFDSKYTEDTNNFCGYPGVNIVSSSDKESGYFENPFPESAENFRDNHSRSASISKIIANFRPAKLPVFD